MSVRDRLARWLRRDPDARVAELRAQLAAAEAALRDTTRKASGAREVERAALRARNQARARLDAVQRIAGQSLPAEQAMDRIRQVLMEGEVGERG